MSSQASPRRVVVTGMATINPVGNSLQESWKNLLEGRSGISTIELFDTQDCPVKIAGEVKQFDVSQPLGPFQPSPDKRITQAANSKEARRVGRFVHLGLVAGLQAYGDSGLDSYRSHIAPERIGINIGAGMGGLPEIEEVHNEFLAKGYKRVTPFFIPQVIPNMASGQLSILLNAKGPNLCNVSACSTSAHSLGESYRLLQSGQVDVMIAGGCESVICKLGIAGFASMKALSTLNDSPSKASRPFDRDRDGFVMSEGGAVMILEDYEHAKKRGAQIYAELVGYGATGDAYHITSPSEGGEGAARAMHLALQDARVRPDQVGYVNAHATSTALGDQEELHAIAKVFPDASSHLNVSSTKSMTGHLLGAAGTLEAIISVQALRESRIPPTINLENVDPKCEAFQLDLTANRAVEKRLNYVLSNSFGFGGTNVSLLFGKI